METGLTQTTAQPRPGNAPEPPVPREVLQLKGVGKRFPGVVALDGVDLDLRSGEVHAICGENGAAGELCAKAMIDRVGQTGKLAVMSYVPGAGSEVGRVGGFRKYIAAHSKLQLVGPFYSQSQMANALDQTTDVLSANPDLKGVFGANEPTAVGMGRALQQSGKSGKVIAIGFDGNQDLQGFVRDGTIQAIAVQSSYQMGYKGMETVVKVIERKPVSKQVDTGVMMVEKQNLDSSEAKNVLY
jgi:ribose transport system substrate-binding protein